MAQKGGNYTDEGCSVVAERRACPTTRGSTNGRPVQPLRLRRAKKGEYAGLEFAAESEKPKKGGFEKLAGPGFGSATETVKLETPGLGRTVVCTASPGKAKLRD